jgi:redox-sensitive bicupin YhaK (pirin superfamily)
MNVSDGAGVKLKRVIGASVDYVDPFLLLDEFKSDSANDYIAGFPDHPHRGFETVTYMLAGSMEHRDHKGNHGTLTSGSIQWMTAGRGIIHSEMPKQDNGLMWGFQLWVNLPAKDKMCEPRYQDIPPSSVPVLTIGDATIKVLAGTVGTVTGPVKGVVTNPTYIDVTIGVGGQYTHQLPFDHTAFAYVFDGGDASFGPADAPTKVPLHHMAVFKSGDFIEARPVEGVTKPVRFILVAASPLKEPMARHGPFVMNTREEIMQAFMDFQQGRF